MPYLDYFKKLKEERHLTQQQIAELSNIPLPTISRIFHGSTLNPTFETISAITIALGGSLDEMMGLKSAGETPVTPQVETTISAYADLLNEKDLRIKEKEENIKLLKEELHVERKVKNKLAIVIFMLLAAVITVLIVDIFNGHFGYFRY